MIMPISRLSIATVLVLAGCGDDAAKPMPDIDAGRRPDAGIPPSCAFDPPDAPTSGTVELGAVDPPDLNNFTQVAIGGNFQVYEGPQGGWHLWIDARVQNIDPGDGSIPTRPKTRFDIYTEDGARINLENCAYTLEYHDGGDGYLYLAKGWLNQIIPTVAITIDNTPLRLEVEVLDRNGNYAVAEQMVNALSPIPTPIGP